MNADDVNLIEDNIRTIERKLLNACKDIDLSVKTEKTKYMGIGHHRCMIENEHIRICSNFYESHPRMHQSQVRSPTD